MNAGSTTDLDTRSARLAEIGGLVGQWDFREPVGEPRLSRDTPEEHALQEVGGPVERVAVDGPGGYAVRFNGGGGHFQIAYGRVGDLNFAGRDAKFSIVAWVKLDTDDARGGTVAGMWDEGLGRGDDSGTRQYSLLLDMPAYGGLKQVTPHVSSEGGATRRSDGSMLPWCADYAATAERYPLGEWCTVGCTYDSNWLTAYLDGLATPREIDPKADRRNDSYFLKEGPDGGSRGMNPFYHGRGLFRYDPATHGKTKPTGGSRFVVGARQVNGKHGSEPLNGLMAHLCIFNRSLTAEEMARTHRLLIR